MSDLYGEEQVHGAATACAMAFAACVATAAGQRLLTEEPRQLPSYALLPPC